MKFKKTLYGITAAAVALSSLSATAVTPIAEDVQISGEGTSETTTSEPTYIERDGIRYEVKGDSLSVSKLLDETMTEINIPAEIDGKPVAAIGEAAFRQCDKLESIDIPGSVKSIGNSAFAECSNLASVKIADGVGSIGKYAFQYCVKLESIDIPDSVYSIGSGTFSGCSSLTAVKLSNGIQSIESNMFYRCQNLTSINIPYGIESIGEDAFQLCGKLESIDIPDSIVTIGRHAFSMCESLTSFTFPKGVKAIESNVLYGCTDLTDITIEGNNIMIGKRAFDDCTNLSNVKINGSIYTIGDSAFAGCVNLRELTIPNGAFSIGAYSFEDSGLNTVTIPKSVEIIDKTAFSGKRIYQNGVLMYYESPKIETIIYGGTEEQWNRLLESSEWDGGFTIYNPESNKNEYVLGSYKIEFNKEISNDSPTNALEAPTNFRTDIDVQTATICWDEVEGATGYIVMYHSENYGWIARKVPTNSITINNLAANWSPTGYKSPIYYYKVAAINDNSISTFASQDESGNRLQFSVLHPEHDRYTTSQWLSPVREITDLDNLYGFNVDTSDDISSDASDETSTPETSEPEDVSSTPSVPTPPSTSSITSDSEIIPDMSNSEITPDTSNPNDTNSEISSVPNTASRPTSNSEEEIGTSKPMDGQPTNNDDINSLNSNTPESGSTGNPSTGTTMALVPIVLASSAVVAATIKRKKK